MVYWLLSIFVSSKNGVTYVHRQEKMIIIIEQPGDDKWHCNVIYNESKEVLVNRFFDISLSMHPFTF